MSALVFDPAGALDVRVPAAARMRHLEGADASFRPLLSLSLPVEEGERIGSIEITRGGSTARVPAVAGRRIESQDVPLPARMLSGVLRLAARVVGAVTA